MGNNQHTAVEWFYQMILPKNTQAVFLLAKDIEVLFEQAKAMHKDQMLQFGSRVTDRWGLTKVEEHYIEDEYNKYYKETHGE